jgi:hypothetical protein
MDLKSLLQDPMKVLKPADRPQLLKDLGRGRAVALVQDEHDRLTSLLETPQSLALG